MPRVQPLDGAVKSSKKKKKKKTPLKRSLLTPLAQRKGHEAVLHGPILVRGENLGPYTDAPVRTLANAEEKIKGAIGNSEDKDRNDFAKVFPRTSFAPDLCLVFPVSADTRRDPQWTPKRLAQLYNGCDCFVEGVPSLEFFNSVFQKAVEYETVVSRRDFDVAAAYVVISLLQTKLGLTCET
jgi:hypothetical protein